jgi:hypothetical protein
MSRWIVALPLIAVGVSIGDGRAASAVSVVEPLVGALTPAQSQSTRSSLRLPKSAPTVRLTHHLAHSSKPPAHGPLSSVLAKARPAVAPIGWTSEDDKVLRPNSVNTIRVPAPVTTVRAVPQADASDTWLGRHRDADNAPANMVVLADSYDNTRMFPMWPGSPPSPALFTTTELVILLGACGCVAISIYGLVAFDSQRRRTRVGLSRRSGRGCTQASSHTDQYSDPVARQRLFPHQFGASIQAWRPFDRASRHG